MTKTGRGLRSGARFIINVRITYFPLPKQYRALIVRK